MRIVCAVWKLLAMPDVFPVGRVLGEEVLPTVITSIAETRHVRDHYMRERDKRMLGCSWHIIKQALSDPGGVYAEPLARASHEVRHLSVVELQKLVPCSPTNQQARLKCPAFVRHFHAVLSAKIAEHHATESYWVPSLSASFSWIAVQTLASALLVWRARALGPGGAHGVVSSLKSALLLLPDVVAWDAHSGVCIELPARALEALPPIAAACIREALEDRSAPLGRVMRPGGPVRRQTVRFYPDRLADVLEASPCEA